MIRFIISSSTGPDTEQEIKNTFLFIDIQKRMIIILTRGHSGMFQDYEF